MTGVDFKSNRVEAIVNVVVDTANQGAPNTPANAWPVEVTDGTNILGTPTHPVRIDPTGTTSQPVSIAVPVAANILDGNFDSTGAASGTLITIPAGRTWIGYITTSVSAFVNANSSTGTNIFGYTTTAGAGATPSPSALIGKVQVLMAANSATGLTGTNETGSITVRVVAIAPVGNSITLVGNASFSATAGTVNICAVGELQ